MATYCSIQTRKEHWSERLYDYSSDLPFAGSMQTQTAEVEEEEVDEGLPDVHPAGETTGLICL